MLGLWSYAYDYDNPYVAGLTSFPLFCLLFRPYTYVHVWTRPKITKHYEIDLFSFCNPIGWGIRIHHTRIQHSQYAGEYVTMSHTFRSYLTVRKKTYVSWLYFSRCPAISWRHGGHDDFHGTDGNHARSQPHTAPAIHMSVPRLVSVAVSCAGFSIGEVCMQFIVEVIPSERVTEDHHRCEHNAEGIEAKKVSNLKTSMRHDFTKDNHKNIK